MGIQSILQLITALVSLLGINAIPAGLFWWGGASAATALTLYMLETPISFLLGALRVRLLAPADDNAYVQLTADRKKEFEQAHPNIKNPVVAYQNRRDVIGSYVVMSLAFYLFFGAIILLGIVAVSRASVDGSTVLSAMGGIIAFQFFSFVSDLVLMGRISAAQAENIMAHNARRVGLISLAALLGFAASLFDRAWFVTPFVLLKAGTDSYTAFSSFYSHIRLRGQVLLGSAGELR